MNVHASDCPVARGGDPCICSARAEPSTGENPAYDAMASYRTTVDAEGAPSFGFEVHVAGPFSLDDARCLHSDLGHLMAQATHQLGQWAASHGIEELGDG